MNEYDKNEQIKRRSELEKYIWNEAIEAAAARMAEIEGFDDCHSVDEIRKLKKDVTD